jgi:hypothetical protein
VKRISKSEVRSPKPEIRKPVSEVIRTDVDPRTSRVGRSWVSFWFSPVPPVGLHALRILAGLLFLVWLLPFAGDAPALFSQQGWFDKEAFLETSRLPTEASAVLLNWSLLFAVGTSATALQIFYWSAVAVFLLFAVGVATRITGVLTWVFVVSFMANPAIRFDADYLLGILAFYLMVGYLLLGQWSVPQTLWGRIFGRRTTLLLGSTEEPPSHAANFAIRLLQVHFALIVVASGLHKLQFGAWWSGTALWYPMHNPMNTTESQIRALAASRDSFLFVHSVVQYAALAWQLSFPLFAWRPGKMRLVLLGGAALGWLACWYAYQLPLFGPIYLIGCLSYLTPSEWLALRSWITRRLPVQSAALRTAAPLVLVAAVAILGTACPPSDHSTRKSPDTEPVTANKEPVAAEPLPPLGKDPAEKVPVLRTRIDAALQMMRNRVLFNEHSFWTVFHQILGVGPESAYLLNNQTGQRVKTLDFVCDGGSIRGMEFMDKGTGRADVRTMPGSGTFQGHQDQFVAEMAQWGMPLDRKMMVQGKEHKFGDFTLYSKERTSVRSDQELSWAIIIIAQYYGTNITWTNSLGETLHFDDVVRYEMHQPIKETPVCGGTHRLFGLTWAYHQHMAKGGQKTAVWKEVEDLTRGYMELAHKLQNLDGSFSTEYFRGPGNNQTDLTLRIHSTGHILEWLALALTDEELRQPWMEKAADALTVLMLNNRDQGLDGGAVYHAAHGLEIYRNRVFGPTPHPPLIPLLPK